MSCKSCHGTLPTFRLGLCVNCLETLAKRAESYQSIILQLLNHPRLNGVGISFEITPELPITQERIDAWHKAMRDRSKAQMTDEAHRLEELRMDALAVLLKVDKEIGSLGQKLKE